MSQADGDGALAAARSWIASKGWLAPLYVVRLSDAQQCPEGQLSVDVVRKQQVDLLSGSGSSEAAELLDDFERRRLSRVLEISVATGEIVSELALRDESLLERFKEDSASQKQDRILSMLEKSSN